MGLFNTDRLSRSERKRLRELRRGQKAKGFKKKSHLGLTSYHSRNKRKIEAKRRKARGEDFGKAVLAASAVGAGAAMAPAAVTSTVAPAAAPAAMTPIAPAAISTGVAPAATGGLITSGTGITGSSIGIAGGVTAASLAGTGGAALGTTAAATPTALTTGQKILQGVKKAKKVYDQAKPYIDTAKDIAGAFRGGEEEQQAPPNYYNPLAGPVGRGYAQSSNLDDALTVANVYGTPMAPAPQAQPYTELASRYGMGMITDPNAYMQNMSNMEIYNQNIRQNVLQADNAQTQNLAGLGATLKSGGRIKKSLGNRYKMGGRIKTKQKY